MHVVIHDDMREDNMQPVFQFITILDGLRLFHHVGDVRFLRDIQILIDDTEIGFDNLIDIVCGIYTVIFPLAI